MNSEYRQRLLAHFCRMPFAGRRRKLDVVFAAVRKLQIPLALMMLAASHAAAAEEEKPLQMVAATEPEHAAETIRMQNGFRAELIAAEPLVTDPVDIAYDENGLAYVAEMLDYPYTDAADDKPWEEQQSAPIGRVRLLEDTDGDGKFDRSAIFADKLSWPAGIACSQGGVYVAATPDLLFLKDTDGDGRADIRRVVFKGFRKYNVQAVMNSLRWGLDNKIYAAGSSNGGQVTERDGTVHRFGRSDFCFDPRKETFEVVSGGARFGASFDDWGNRFLCSIRQPLIHVVFPDRYQKRNPALSLASTNHDAGSSGDAIPVYRVSPPEPWRVLNAEREAKSAETTRRDAKVATGYATSFGGVTIYRGAAYPEEFSGNSFVTEVAGNLAARYVIKKDGVTFKGQRPDSNADFLASTDNWFRAVNFANAPDGTLHVLDMYRQTIEHPWSLPDDLQERLDLTEGRDRGRIYRLLPPRYREGFKPPGKPQLGNAGTADLVAELANPNGWWRETAQRLLFERQDQSAVPALRKLLETHESALTRLHAAWTLHGLGALSRNDVRTLLRSEDTRLLTHAVRLAEPFLAEQDISNTVLSLSKSESMQLRFQVALTLGEHQSAEATRALTDMLRRDGHDKWMRAAIISSIGGQELPTLKALLNDASFAKSEIGQQVVQELISSVAANASEANVCELLNQVSEPDYSDDAGSILQQRFLLSTGGGLKRRGKSLTSLKFAEGSTGSQLVNNAVSRAFEALADDELPIPERCESAPILKFVDFERVHDLLLKLLEPSQPDDIQATALNTLTAFSNLKVADLLLERYPSMTPSRQQTVAVKLMGRSSWQMKLLRAIEAGTVSTSQVPWYRQDIFMKSRNEELRNLAVQLFAGNRVSSRSPIISQFQAELSKASDGDAKRGLEIYRKHCSNCHKFRNEGYEVGPHLSTVRNRTPAELLANILDPNREISPTYLMYVVVTVDGKALSGVVKAETSTSITLRDATKKEHVVLRSDIEEIKNTGQSIMPVGLEKNITAQDMADLISFIKAQ